MIKLHSQEEALSLFGRNDENLRLIEEELGVTISSRGENVNIQGPEENSEKARHLLSELLGLIHKGIAIHHYDVAHAVAALKKEGRIHLLDLHVERIDVSSKRQYISPKTKTQKNYIEAIRKHDIVFGIGPAGTGKTYLAMAMAVNALKNQEVARIILTRPAIGAGETLGFLPGDLSEKVSPYLRPLYDALYDMMELERIEKYIERGIIEVAPFAFMRGRTFNDSFIVLDEAQNCTPEQLKMFLTRLGFDSKTVITGDITQSDLPGGKPIGLLEAQKILAHLPGVKFIYFSSDDAVRHHLVQKIIEAYAAHEEAKNNYPASP
jgi:phosphate starvation-inducible PhoH-like protein